MELYSALKVLCRPGPGDRPIVRIFQLRPESVTPLQFNTMLSANSNLFESASRFVCYETFLRSSI